MKNELSKHETGKAREKEEVEKQNFYLCVCRKVYDNKKQWKQNIKKGKEKQKVLAICCIKAN